jgi:hypothetical protein
MNAISGDDFIGRATHVTSLADLRCHCEQPEQDQADRFFSDGSEDAPEPGWPSNEKLPKTAVEFKMY